MGNVLVVGSLNMDMVVSLGRFPHKGETVHAEKIKYIPGGKGANSAVAASRLGASVKMAGCVGKDDFGGELINHLADDGVNVDYVNAVDCLTGLAIVLLDNTVGENSIVVSSGANSFLKPPAGDDWYESAKILLLQLETPYETVLEAAREAYLRDIKVILDPAPASFNLPKELFSYVNILLPNETELATLTGLPVNSLESAQRAAKKLILNTAIEDIVVTLGENGSLWVSDKHVQHIKSHSVDVLDTTAAGDTFAGALAVSLASEKSFHDALIFANAASALTCTQFGAQSSIPRLVDVKNFIESSDNEN